MTFSIFEVVSKTVQNVFCKLENKFILSSIFCTSTKKEKMQYTYVCPKLRFSLTLRLFPPDFETMVIMQIKAVMLWIPEGQRIVYSRICTVFSKRRQYQKLKKHLGQWQSFELYIFRLQFHGRFKRLIFLVNAVDTLCFEIQ